MKSNILIIMSVFILLVASCLALVPPKNNINLKGLSRLCVANQKQSLTILKVTQSTKSTEDRSTSMMSSFLDTKSLIYQAALVGITLVINWFTGQLDMSFVFLDFEGMTIAVLLVAPLIIGRLVFVSLKDIIFSLNEIKRETRKFVMNKFGSETTAKNAILLSLLLSFTSGVSNELFFRGLLFNSVEYSTNAIVALFLSSGIFGLVSSQLKRSNIAAEVFKGAVLGYAYWYSDYNLAVPIAMHTMYDFVTQLFITWYFSKNVIHVSDQSQYSMNNA